MGLRDGPVDGQRALGLAAAEAVEQERAAEREDGGVDLEIDAAILALNGSFLLDRFGCGESKGTLTVNGAIAQAHRGLVGTSGGSGFTKNYIYDSRLKYRSPPYFLDPLNASWHVVRQVEQTPPAYDCNRTPLPAGCP